MTSDISTAETHAAIRLMYPLELYYPDGVPGVPTDEEQAATLAAYRAYAETVGRKLDADDPHPAVRALHDMLDTMRQYDYFKGVRDMVNALLSGNRTPEELFRAMFPEHENKVDEYTCQFADACDLILLKDQVDWPRMNLPWFDYARKEGLL